MPVWVRTILIQKMPGFLLMRVPKQVQGVPIEIQSVPQKKQGVLIWIQGIPIEKQGVLIWIQDVLS